MKLSRTNLERINSERKKALSGRNQFETKRKAIKDKEKKLLE